MLDGKVKGEVGQYVVFSQSSLAKGMTVTYIFNRTLPKDLVQQIDNLIKSGAPD